MVDAVAEWSNAASRQGAFTQVNIAGSNPVRVFSCFNNSAARHTYLWMVGHSQKGVRYERCRVRDESTRGDGDADSERTSLIT